MFDTGLIYILRKGELTMSVWAGIGLFVLGLLAGITIYLFIAGASKYDREYEIFREGYEKGYSEGQQGLNKEGK